MSSQLLHLQSAQGGRLTLSDSKTSLQAYNIETDGTALRHRGLGVWARAGHLPASFTSESS